MSNIVGRLAERSIIVEGYAFGAIIQCEIEGSQGARFMAHQHERRSVA